MTTELDPGSMLTFIDFLKYVNSLSDYVLLPGFLFVIFILTFYRAGNNNGDKLLVSGLITAVIATLMATVQLINMWFMVFFWVLSAVGIFMSMWGDN